MAKRVQLLINGVKEIAPPIQRAFRKLEEELNELIAIVDELPTTSGGGTVQDGENVGGAAEVFKELVGSNLQFRTILAGANITVNETADTIEIVATVPTPPDPGEVNTGSSVGTGADVFKDKTGVDLRFRSIVAGDGIVVTEDADEVVIEVDGYAGMPVDGFFGSGEHGDLVFDGTTAVVLAVNGITLQTLTPASNVYTLTADVVADDLTVNSGVQVKVNGYRVFVAGTLTLNGRITANGADGEGVVDANGDGAEGHGGPGGVGYNAHTLAGSLAGGTGGAQGGGTGSAGGTSTKAPRGAKTGADLAGTPGNMQGAVGGNNATSGTSPGSGGTVTVPSEDVSPTAGIIWNAISGKHGNGDAFTGGSGGGGGAGSTSAGNGGGGGGGAGGGVMVLAYRGFTGSGSAEVKGGNGGYARQTEWLGVPTQGGGGSGGGGGLCILVSGSGVFPVVSVAGGTPGASGPGNSNVAYSGGAGLSRLYSIKTAGIGGGGGSGTIDSALNVGGQAEVFKDVAGTALRFRTIKAGTGVTVTQNPDDITLATAGEANTASNVGVDAQVFKAKTGVDLAFRTLKAGSNMTVTQNANDITLSSSGGGGSVAPTVTVTVAASTAAVNLTTEGTLDFLWLGNSSAWPWTLTRSEIRGRLNGQNIIWPTITPISLKKPVTWTIANVGTGTRTVTIGTAEMNYASSAGVGVCGYYDATNASSTGFGIQFSVPMLKSVNRTVKVYILNFGCDVECVATFKDGTTHSATFTGAASSNTFPVFEIDLAGDSGEVAHIIVYIKTALNVQPYLGFQAITVF